jgi:hypothetical protein
MICSLKNLSEHNVAVLKDNFLSTNRGPEFLWYAEIKYKSKNIQRAFPLAYVTEFAPTASDYFVIKSNEDYKLNFIVNLNELPDTLIRGYAKEFINTTYGEYTVQLFYEDFFCNHEWALKGSISSNIVNVNYRKE